MVYRGSLENCRAARFRGFESHPLRHSENLITRSFCGIYTNNRHPQLRAVFADFGSFLLIFRMFGV